MRASESVAAVYFIYLFVVALLKPAWPRRITAACAALAGAGVAVATPWLGTSAAANLVRDWLPALFLLAGYWLSGWYFVAPMTRLEDWLLRIDRSVLGPAGAIVHRLPRVVVEVMEVAYSTCTLVLPGGLVLLEAFGHGNAADHFWTIVLATELTAFAMLPWIQTRPPRALEPDSIDSRQWSWRRFNRWQLSATSIGCNTLPSGHVAGLLATALAVSDVMPAAFPWLLGLAIVIGLATVLGRYHYLVDALSGAVLAIVVWIAVLLIER